MMDKTPLICHHCGQTVHPGRGAFYVVRIEAFADPTPPTITAEDLDRDVRAEIESLLDNMHDLSGQEAMDQVYRRLTIYLCNACYRKWIEDPAG